MSIIKNYGFFWERKYINRGKGKSAGHLRGRRSGIEADFRDQIGVYVLYDWNQRIVYVGQAGNGSATLMKRLKDHMDGRLSGRWEFFSWFGFRSVNGDGSLSNVQKIGSVVSGFTYASALDQLEGILIEVLEPALNKQAGRLRQADEFDQVVDLNVTPVSNNELYELITQIDQRMARIEGKG